MGYNEEMKDLLTSQLSADEKVLWSGQPDPSELFTGADLFLIPFSLLWSGGVFWAAGMFFYAFFTQSGQTENEPFGILVLSVMVVIGFYFLIGRFWYKIAKKKRTQYALTNKRILIASDFGGSNFTSVYLNSIPSIGKSIKGNGTGTITFGSSPNFAASLYGNTGLEFFGTFYGAAAPTFYDVKDAEEVYQQISKLKGAA